MLLNTSKLQTTLKSKLTVPVLIIGAGILISFLMISGSVDRFLIRHTFDRAFFYRAVGNCDQFIEYVAVDKDRWLNRCTDEKESGGRVPIKDFKVLRIDKVANKAFLQVELTREKRTYAVNYEMVKDGWWSWSIVTEIKE